MQFFLSVAFYNVDGYFSGDQQIDRHLFGCALVFDSYVPLIFNGHFTVDSWYLDRKFNCHRRFMLIDAIFFIIRKYSER